ncbi:MAG: hypothetical protein Q9167_004118 [Letrouitia subvulpina]
MTESHFVAQKFQDYQRLSARGFACQYCLKTFDQETTWWDHVKRLHQDLSDLQENEDGQARRRLRQRAIEYANKTTQRNSNTHESTTSPNRSSHGSDSTRPILGEDVPRDLDSKISDIGNLSIGRETSTGHLKRETAEDPSRQSSTWHIHNFGRKAPSARHAKALSSGHVDGRSTKFIHEEKSSPQSRNARNHQIASIKRLFDPNTDHPSSNASSPKRNRNQERLLYARQSYDPSARISGLGQSLQAKEAIQEELGSGRDNPVYPSSETASVQPVSLTKPSTGTPGSPQLAQASQHPEIGEPKMIRQPETRPISHEQLVVEVKGIYQGLVMVEAKCIEVDEKQSFATGEPDHSKHSKLTDDQWQALIALHKTLLHEHHDFFLASQHPSASPALSRLAAKYSMPARMWRHGIHAFLEVLRHRLPASFDHMLAFLYIAYSMMALLYETVPAFEETWIECLGDLARYRMAIENNDPRDREVWGGVARFWYNKAADKSPKTGRLLHHLGILARGESLEQLSYYFRSLTCIIPFESARGSIKAFFRSYFEARDFAGDRPRILERQTLERLFVECHESLYFRKPQSRIQELLEKICHDHLDAYIGRVTSKFKAQGVFIALTNIAAIFECGGPVEEQPLKSFFRLAFEESNEIRARNPKSSTHEHVFDVNKDLPQSPPSRHPRDLLTSIDLSTSIHSIRLASVLTFKIFSISIQRIGDKNTYPMAHVMFVFLWSLTKVEKAMQCVEANVPWADICAFLRALSGHDAMTPKVFAKGFPQPDKEREEEARPLPEDFLLRCQMYTMGYFPDNWFAEGRVDIEERALELPSMAAPRIERILWLAIQIASVGHRRWIIFDRQSGTFTVTDYALGLARSSEEQITREVVETNAPKVQAQGTAISSANDAKSIEQGRNFYKESSGDKPDMKDDDVEMADTLDTPKKGKMYQYSYNSRPLNLAPSTAIDQAGVTNAFRPKHSGSDPLKVKIVNDSEDVELADPPEA